MRNMLALLAVVVLVLAGVGYYRDWYKVQSTGNDVSITINKDKVKTDVRHGEEKVHQALEKGSEGGKVVETNKSGTGKLTPE